MWESSRGFLKGEYMKSIPTVLMVLLAMASERCARR